MGVGNVFVLRRGVRSLLFYSGSSINENLNGLAIRFLFGIVIGLTAIGIIYSPWGKQSGAHMNPAVTLAFLLVGKIKPWDATFYVIAHFIDALIGLLLVALFMNSFLSDPSVNYIVTVPGEPGPGFAFLAESRSEHALYVRQSYGIDGETAGVPGALRQGKAIH